MFSIGEDFEKLLHRRSCVNLVGWFAFLVSYCFALKLFLGDSYFYLIVPATFFALYVDAKQFHYLLDELFFRFWFPDGMGKEDSLMSRQNLKKKLKHTDRISNGIWLLLLFLALVPYWLFSL